MMFCSLLLLSVGPTISTTHLHIHPRPLHRTAIMVVAQQPAIRRGETLKESSKEKDVRLSNIVAAKGE